MEMWRCPIKVTITVTLPGQAASLQCDHSDFRPSGFAATQIHNIKSAFNMKPIMSLFKQTLNIPPDMF